MTKSTIVLCVLNFFFSSLIVTVHSSVFAGKDVTSVLFGKDSEGIYPGAFGDFNADKLTDVFSITHDRTSVVIYLAHDEEPLLRPSFQVNIKTFNENNTPGMFVNITGIAPGDFNGDGLLDLMIAYRQIGTHDVLEVLVCTGNLIELDCVVPTKNESSIEMLQEPLLADVNGDMIMDLIGEYWKFSPQDNKTIPQKAVWIFSPGDGIKYQRYDFNVDIDNKVPYIEHYNYTDSELRVITPSSNAIVDTDGDTVPELVMMTRKIEGKHFYNFIEYYRIEEQLNDKEWKFTLTKVVPISQNLSSDEVNVVGQPLFLDLSQTGQLVHLLPFCHDLKCRKSGLKVISASGQVDDLEIEVSDDGDDLDKWNFIVGLGGSPHDDFYTRTITLRVGDYNMDGFPDLVGALWSAKKDFRAVIFENVPCVNKTNRKEPCAVPRTFRLNLQSLATYKDVVMTTFYDIYEDGLLDILLVQRTSGPAKKSTLEKYRAVGIQGSPDYDANFLKVVVTTGKNCPKCPFGGPPYGNILPGPIIKYVMSTQEGIDQTSIATQFYRSAHLPLDLPYLYFGLGHSPNFIETMDVSLSPTKKRTAHHVWTQLIPNSQVIIIPYVGRGMGKEWKAKIFLPSSKAALHTFGVLVSFCAAIFFVVLVFHWKERREDRQERLLESHRFHMM